MLISFLSPELFIYLSAHGSPISLFLRPGMKKSEMTMIKAKAEISRLCQLFPPVLDSSEKKKKTQLLFQLF